ncbi:cyclic nucleotide-gated ion channel 1 [Quercus suber]|uniref:Cyclic nucleotide-gated ion channel 1 n=1 Tax=Quercus suber TaxID=58331 RepID=A0AAW0JQE5_QUESU
MDPGKKTGAFIYELFVGGLVYLKVYLGILSITGQNVRPHDPERGQDETNGGESINLLRRLWSSMTLCDWYLQSWRIIFGVSCVIAVVLDPLFFYVPVIINEDKKCIGMDKKLGAISLILRFFTDIIGIINIILQFRNGYKDENLGEEVKDFRKIARRYLWPYFVIDILVILPFPQVIILIIFRRLKVSKSLIKRKSLTFLVLFQYVPRVIQIFQSWKDPKKRVDKLSETPKRVKAAFNFFLYIIASHVSLILYQFYIHEILTLKSSINLKPRFCSILDFENITKPLSKGRRVRFGPASDGWVLFRYERLPVFCYWCGRLTHDAKDCDVWIHSKGTLNIQQQPFGDWMRAPQMSMARRKVISVAGQETQKVRGSQENGGPKIPCIA